MSDGPGPPDDGRDWSRAANPPGSLPFETKPLPLPPKWSAPAADAPISGIWQKLNPSKIRCTGSSCGDNLHCFRLTRTLARSIGPGTCRVCKQPLISMERTGQRNLADIDHTFSALQLEYVRHYFWHLPFGNNAMGYARRAGRIALEARIARRIQTRIGATEPYLDGRQTPTAPSKADALDVAMHAVAACCRVCAGYWHGIPQGRPLTPAEIAYLGELMQRYLRARLPDLDDRGQKVPRRAAGAKICQFRADPAAPANPTAPPLEHQRASRHGSGRLVTATPREQ